MTRRITYSKDKSGVRRKPDYQRSYLRNIRMEVIEVLGGECINCSFDDWRALQIDHINGGGTQERKMKLFNGNFHKHVIKSALNGENKYQLLCANCNWIKRYKNKESTGRKSKKFTLDEIDVEDTVDYN